MRTRYATGLASLALTTALTAAASADEARCEAVLAGVRRLVLVTVRGVDERQGNLHLFERTRPDAPWRVSSKVEPAVIGRAGLAWGHRFRAQARDGERLKHEGDGRTPAGFYRIGRSFGFSASARPGHLVLEPGRAICIDDPGSPAYNTIVAAEPDAVKPRGEDMGAEPLYRRGLVIDYPSDARARAGSCIFLHVWRGPGQGTAGCVALPEPRVKAIQDFADEGSVIAILPEQALSRFRVCLKGTAMAR